VAAAHALVCLACTVVAVSAAVEPAVAGESSATGAGLRAASEFLSIRSLVVPGIQVLDGGQQELDARAAAIASPAAVARRQTSQTAFERLSTSHASKVDGEAFPALFGQPAGGVPRLPAGQKIVRYLSDTVAQVDLGSGQHGVLESVEPIATESSPHHYRPIELRLSESGGAFDPQAPATPVRVPKRLRDGVTISASGVSLAPERDKQASAAQGTQDGAAVVYTNSELDTDSVIKPTVRGFALDTLLRSAASPQTLVFRVGLPGGARLARHMDGSGAVDVIKHGVMIATIPAPTARDAAGTSVPVAMSISGRKLVLRVASHGGSYQYPILVDPEVVTLIEHPGSKGELGHYGGRKWRLNQSGPGQFSAGPAVVSYNGGGNSVNEWASSTYVTNGESMVYELTGEAVDSAGIEGWVEFAEEHGPPSRQSISRSETPTKLEPFCALPGCAPYAGAGHNSFTLGMIMRLENESSQTMYVKNAALYISQPKATHSTVSLNQSSPEVDTTANVLYKPSGAKGAWLSRQQGAFEATASDLGLGLAETRIEVQQPNGEWKKGPTNDYLDEKTGGMFEPIEQWEKEKLQKEIENRVCYGVQCREKLTQVFTYESMEAWLYFHNGEDKIRFAARDAMAGTDSSEHGEGEAVVRFDQSPPKVKLYGLHASGHKPVGEPEIYELTESPTHLAIEATDGENGIPSSGVRSVQVGIDGKEIGSPGGSCPEGPCSVTRELTLNGRELGVGRHTLNVIATDSAGNVGYEEATLVVSAATPLSIGPGSVNPDTGDFATEATDVSLSGGIGSLAVTRHYESLNPKAGAEGPLGPQWSLSLGSLASLEALPDNSVMVVGPNGLTHFAVKRGGGFEAPVGDTSLTLEYVSSNAEYLLKDPAQGTTTRFTRPAGAKSWMPTVSEGPVASDTVTDEYASVEVEGKKIVEPTLELAPHPSATCARGKMQPGCRALEFEYAGETTAHEGTGHNEASSEWGDYKGHLKQVTAVVWDPSGKEMTKGVAAYEYDKQGRLRAEWDPRVASSTSCGGPCRALKTTYSYDSEGHVTTIAPPGVEPWYLHYGPIASDPTAGRLLSVTRPVGLGQNATSTIVYEVPVSGVGAPHQMALKEVELWGQKDYPATATAIFPPDEVPASPPSDYRRATIYYRDGQARAVNVASPSGAISTSEYNETNNVVRHLSAAARAQAVKESNPVYSSQLLDTKSVYTNEGTRLKETLGPQHKVKLAKGKSGQPEETLARNHVQYYYDEGAPAGETYDLVTKTTDGALTESKEEFDVRTSTTSYAGAGWYLRKPTATTTDVGGLNLTSSVVYDENTGNPIEKTSPAGTAAKPNALVASSLTRLGSTGARLESPRGVAVNQKTGNVYVTDYARSAIVVFNASGEFLKTIGSPGSGPGQMLQPEAIALDPKGNLWVGDSGNKRLDVLDEEGKPVPNEDGEPLMPGTFGGPIQGIAVNSEYAWASDPSDNNVKVFGVSGRHKGFLGTGRGKKYGEFRGPTGVALSGPLVYVADSGNNRVQAFTMKKKRQKGYGPQSELNQPQGIAFDPTTGNLAVANYEGKGVQEFTPSGTYIGQLASVGTRGGHVSNPTAIAYGASGQLYVADPGNKRVDVWTPTYLSAHTARTVYYSAEANPEYPSCGGRPEWESLPCQTQPAAQPAAAGLPALPVTTITYNMWNQAETKSEAFPASGSYPATTRTRKTTFDDAGRPTTSEETANPSTGTALPQVTDTYNATTGALETQSTTVGATTKTNSSVYNSLGQLERYTDADGNPATYVYDIDGRVKEVKDAKGEQKYTYHETTGFLTELVDSGAGKFTAEYDAAGTVTSETYPNALKIEYERNEAGAATAIKYVKTSHCKSTCPETWFKEAEVPSIHGEALKRESSLSKEQYSYDGGGRLTQVQETPAEGPEACTTRSYSYDEESNRSKLTTFKPGSGGKCASEGGTSEAHTYDGANRLTDSGASYDTFGNTTHLPAWDAGGPEGGAELTSSYYVDNQLSTQTQKNNKTQKTQKNEYRLDPEERTRETISSGEANSTVVSHYDGSGGALAWTSEAGNWTRNVPGMGGELAAIQTSAGNTTLQLHDLHGNIVATVADSEAETKLEKTYNSTEFGVPQPGTSPPKYAWLGASGVASELPSGNIAQDGVTYVPLIGRPLQSEGYASPPIPTNEIAPYSMTLPPWVAQDAAAGAAKQILATQEAERAAFLASIPPGEIPEAPVPPLPVPPVPEEGGGCNEETEGCGPDPEHGNNSLQCKVWASWGHPAPGAGELGVYAHWSCQYAPDGFEAQYALQYVDWGGVEGGEYEMVPPPGKAVWHYKNHGEAHRFWSCEGEKWYRAWVWGRYWFPGGKTVWSASALDGHLEKCGERPPVFPPFG
jgi:YD repeat-containing protein